MLRSLGIAPPTLPLAGPASQQQESDFAPALGRKPVVVLAGVTAVTSAALVLCRAGPGAAGVDAGLVVLIGGGRGGGGDDDSPAWLPPSEMQTGDSSLVSSPRLQWLPAPLQDRACRQRCAPPPPGTSGDERQGSGAAVLLVEPAGGGSGPPAEFPVREVSEDMAADDLVAEHEAIVDAVLDLTVRFFHSSE